MIFSAYSWFSLMGGAWHFLCQLFAAIPVLVSVFLVYTGSHYPERFERFQLRWQQLSVGCWRGVVVGYKK